jgi:hypothetical protein
VEYPLSGVIAEISFDRVPSAFDPKAAVQLQDFGATQHVKRSAIPT